MAMVILFASVKRFSVSRMQEFFLGDSGGPLVALKGDHYTLVGVTSWRLSCKTQDTPAGFTDVAKSMTWINKVMGT